MPDAVDTLIEALRVRGMAGMAIEWPDGRISVFAESYAGAYQAIYRRGPIVGCTIRPEEARLQCVAPGVAMLWALALEADEHGATLTGDRVCARCDGTGEAPESDEEFRKRIAVEFTFDGGPMIRRAAVDCLCDGETKPATVSLAWVVEQLAAMRSPMVTDWPERWAVDVDAMEANGSRATWLPSQGPRAPKSTVTIGGCEIPSPWCEPTPAWVCRWWQAFREWTATGREPDVDELAGLLAERTEARRKAGWSVPTSSMFGDQDVAEQLMRELAEYVPTGDDVPDAFGIAGWPRTPPVQITIAGWTFDAQHTEVSETRRTAHVDVILTEADARALVTSGIGEPVHITSGGDAWTGSLADAQVFRPADRPTMPRVRLRVDQVRRVRRADLRGLNPARATFTRPGDSARGDGLDCEACDGSGTAEQLQRDRSDDDRLRERLASATMTPDEVERIRRDIAGSAPTRGSTSELVWALCMDHPTIQPGDIEVRENRRLVPHGPLGPHSVAIIVDGDHDLGALEWTARDAVHLGASVQVFARAEWDAAGMPDAPDGSD